MARSTPPHRPPAWRQALPSGPARDPRRGVGQPPRPTAHARPPPPDSLAAGVVAAGAEHVDLGLRRLPGRRAPTGPGAYGWLFVLGVTMIVVAGALWLQNRAVAPERVTTGSPAGIPAARPAAAGPQPPAAAPRDREAQPMGAIPAPVVEMAPGPGGLAVSIRPVEFNYSVAPGDTLDRIARRYGTTVDAIVGMNNLPDRHNLQVGQKLIVP